MSRIPVTIVTGFLGAGKTTLLKQLLSEPNIPKLAIIQNEFGPENIDSALLADRLDGELIQVTNGCICCNVREDLLEAVQILIAKRRRGLIEFEAIVLETTGLADPGPIILTFYADGILARECELDGVITLVAADTAAVLLDSRAEVARQIGFADRLLITRGDLVGPETVVEVRALIKAINSHCQILEAPFGRTSANDILRIGGFSVKDVWFAISPNARKEEVGDKAEPGIAAWIPQGRPDRLRRHHHNAAVQSFGYRTTGCFSLDLLGDFLEKLQEEYGQRLLRYKGILNIKGSDYRTIVHGVQSLMGSDIGEKWEENRMRESRLIFIGEGLDANWLEQRLAKCLI